MQDALLEIEAERAKRRKQVAGEMVDRGTDCAHLSQQPASYDASKATVCL